jgi:hypothetical protein
MATIRKPPITKSARAELFAKLKPIEIAQWVYRYTGHAEDTFAKELWEHLFDGIVCSSPAHFGMARAVVLDDGRLAWLINSAVGKLPELIKLFPFPLPFIAFYRFGGEKLRVLPFSRFEKLTETITSWTAQPYKHQSRAI